MKEGEYERDRQERGLAISSEDDGSQKLVQKRGKHYCREERGN